jgi:DNA-binding XRE family transcriptional regulator
MNSSLRGHSCADPGRLVPECGRIILATTAGPRHTKRISQEDLAYEADVNRTYLSKLEKGVSYPGLEIIAKLAAELLNAA